MYHIKSELNKVLGRIEDLGKYHSLNYENLHPLLDKAYKIIVESFDIEQCHSILHQLRNHMRTLNQNKSGGDPSKDTDALSIEKVRKESVKELQVFISHL